MDTTAIDLKRGEAIFNNIVEYPLPKKTGVRDYIFYQVSAADRYGKAARKFLRKYYKNHHTKKINSLEEIIDHLHAEIQSKDIKQIREIVLVSHGNSIELVIPVTKHAFDSEENKKKYQRITAGSIANLQEAFRTGDANLTRFNDRRKEVLKKLSDTSWITIRACNFGTSRDGLYALYSFFGGKANVYAPHEYQVFVEKMPIVEDSRIKSDLDYYQHLVKQGFVQRKKKHSEKRRLKIIRKLIDPGRSKHGFELSGYQLNNNRVVFGNKEEYDSFVESFNQKKIPDTLKEIFLTQKLTLSEDARIQKKREDEKWVLYDNKFKIDNHVYKIEYTLLVEYDEFLDDQNHKATLFVYPILNHRSSLPSIPIQLFFSDDQAKAFKGELFELAAFAANTVHEGNPADKANYEGYEKLLDTGALEDNEGHNIISAFEEEAPLKDPKIVQLPPVNGKKQWEIQSESNSYRIQESFTHIYPQGFKKALKVFVRITKEDQQEFISYNGSDPDTPGTELMAYLDNLTKEELLDLIHFLRKPYLEEHAFYIDMAQQALHRKSDFLKWFSESEEFEKSISEPLYFSPLTNLSRIENDHKDKYAYVFSNVWMEVKASSSRKKEFNSDLFEEVELPFAPTLIEEVQDPDTPVQDPDLPGGVPDPPAEFFEKDVIFEDEIPEDISCQKFKDVLEILKEHKGKRWEELETVFKHTEIDENTTLYDYLTANAGFSSIKLANDILQIFSPYASGSGSTIARLGALASSRVAFISSTVFAIAGPLIMLKNMIDQIQTGKKKYKRAGTILGFMQANRMMFDIIYKNRFNDIPILDEYDLLSDAPDHFQAYHNLTYTVLRIPLAEFIEPFKEGYEEGIRVVSKHMNEDLKRHMSIFKQYAAKKGLKECQLKVLLSSGMIDESKVKSAILFSLYTQIAKVARFDRIEFDDKD